jgi:hypothetical protein
MQHGAAGKIKFALQIKNFSMLYETTKFTAAFARVRDEKYPGSEGKTLKLTLKK